MVLQTSGELRTLYIFYMLCYQILKLGKYREDNT